MTAYWDNIGKPTAISAALYESLALATVSNTIQTWDMNPLLRGIRNVAAERPSFGILFKEFAENPFIWAPASHKAMAGYIHLTSVPAGANEELEAIGLFTEKLLKSIHENNEQGLGNASNYFLYTSAARIGERHKTDSLSSAEVLRREEMVKVWPTVIVKSAHNDHRAVFGYSLYALAQPFCPVTTQQELFNLISKRAVYVANTHAEDCEALCITLTKLEEASGYITGDHKPSVATGIANAWQTTVNALYRYDPTIGVDWAANLSAQATRPVHPAIRQAAQRVATTYAKPLPPTGIVTVHGVADDYSTTRVIGSPKPA